jgi:selenium metabolism protein YedF
MIKVDAIGKLCPAPIIMTKKALKEIEEGEIEVLVDNTISAENVKKMCKEMGLSFVVTKEGEVYTILINKVKAQKEEEVNSKGTVVVIEGNMMGKGDEILGKTLMKGFIYALTEMESLPDTIICYNSGVLLATEGSESLKDLQMLEENGVEILCCGACANYYGVQDKIKVGTITNMYNIVEKQLKGKKIIKP